MQTATADSSLPPASVPPPSHGFVTSSAPSAGGSLAEAETYRHTPIAQPSELTPEDLRAPVSAMHNMSHHGNSFHRRSMTLTDADCSADQRSVLRPGLLFGRETRQEDMVSKGILDQRQARKLFNT